MCAKKVNIKTTLPSSLKKRPLRSNTPSTSLQSLTNLPKQRKKFQKKIIQKKSISIKKTSIKKQSAPKISVKKQSVSKIVITPKISLKKKSISKTPIKAVEVEPQNSIQESKKTPSLPPKKSYLDIIKEYIDKSSKKLDRSPHASYTILEDLKIIYEIAMDESSDGQGPKFWKKLIRNGILNRPPESLRDRYKRFLRFLQKEDFDKIIDFLRTNGIYGYLIFSKEENNGRALKNIVVNDPVKSTSTSKKPLLNEEITGKVENIEGPNSEPNSMNENKNISQSDPIKGWESNIKSVQNILISNYKSVSSLWKENKNLFVNETEKIFYSPLIIKKTFDKNENRTVITDFAWNLESLQASADLIREQYNLNKDQIAELLMSVSGVIEDLKDLLENKNESLKWMLEDDLILENAESKDDDAFKLLLRYKGEQRIRKRIEFLQLQMKFEF